MKRTCLLRGTEKKGAALVIVLGLLTLIVILMVAFISSVSTELQSAKSYASGQDARSLADSTVNVVISQIQDATENPQFAWASQPGMIRTYDSTGNPVAAFKLYSSSSIRVAGAFDPISTLTTEIPSDWATRPAQFTDLNKPVMVAGVNQYPILSAKAVAKNSSGGTPLEGTGSAIEGCYLDTTNTIAATSATQTNPVPMPVRWMYVLKDGKITSTDPSTGKIAGATSSNPIVGRMAFWTDDESCKVNINTASEGTFWDRPYTDGPSDTSSDPVLGFEKKLSTRIPVQNEFQRYPGHPATTCLSPIFPIQDGETQTAYSERIYGIIPRIIGGGSTGGTVAVTGTTAPLVPDTQRLFASVDEFLFQVSSAPRQTNSKSPTAKFSEDDIDKTRFFLTTNSRSPEVNLFNKPRITLWPIQANTSNIGNPTGSASRNAKDKLIAFCSTIGSKPYYFQRYNIFDTSQIRTTGGAYNPSQNPIPSSQSPSLDWTEIPRNQELFSYLQYLTSNPIPGLGGKLSGTSGKYSIPIRDQILTEMMDYIRSGLNTFNTRPSTGATAVNTPYYSYVPFGVNSSGVASNWVSGQSQVVPLVIQPPGASYKTKGFGRFSTITQAALIFYRTDKLQYVPNPASAIDIPTDLPTSGTIPGKITVLNFVPGVPFTIPPFAPFTYPSPDPFTNADLNAPTMKCVILLQTFNPTPGAPPWSGNVRYVIENANNLSVTNGPTTTNLFPSQMANLVNAQEGYYDATALSGLELCTHYWNNGTPLPTPAPKDELDLPKVKSIKSIGPATVGSPTEEEYYPFVSVPVPLNASTFNINGGTIQIKIYSGYANSLQPGDLVQTITMVVPSVTGLPIPFVNYSASYSATSGQTTVSSSNSYTNYNLRLQTNGLNQAFQHNPHPYLIQGDVVRSVQARYLGPALGDLRVIAGLNEVPDDFFEGHGLKDPTTDGLKYSDTAVNSNLMHSLRMYVSEGNEQTGKSNGFLQNNNNYTGLTYTTTSGYNIRGHGKLVRHNVALESVLDPIASGGARPSRAPVAVQGTNGAYMDAAATLPGDWDTGPGTQIDGPYINKADEGNSNIGYYNTGGNTTAGTIVETGASFAPNRQVASAVTFGSLPTGINPSSPALSQGWRTLLFCKNPSAGSLHPGFGIPASGPPYTTPPDFAFLDFFTMPVVEPYAISEPFSTAGKINMNYQIVPFAYLKRNTGIRAVLKSAKMMAIPTVDGRNYKSGATVDFTLTMPPTYRYEINPSEQAGTLAGFEERFNKGDIFRSASEICGIFLVPGNKIDGTAVSGNPTYTTMESWWNTYKLTGDNLRENPYGHIYPRLTTKSNTYTVHVQTQSLKKIVGTAADAFVEGTDQVTGEYRGSFVIERYLDPNTDGLVKADGSPGSETDPDSMVGPYKFRILSSKRFAP